MNPLIKKDDRMQELNNQLLRAGVMGMLKGSLIGVVTGLALMFRYNRGHTTHFFRLPYKCWYLSSWAFAGIMLELIEPKTT